MNREEQQKYSYEIVSRLVQDAINYNCSISIVNGDDNRPLPPEGVEENENYCDELSIKIKRSTDKEIILKNIFNDGRYFFIQDQLFLHIHHGEKTGVLFLDFCNECYDVIGWMDCISDDKQSRYPERLTSSFLHKIVAGADSVANKIIKKNNIVSPHDPLGLLINLKFRCVC